MYKNLFVISLIALFTNISLADVYVESTKRHYKKPCCIPTKSYQIPISEKPVEYAHYNDITRTEGEFPDNFINKVIIKGKITDKHCVPVPNARITISQKDSYGVYRFIRAALPIFEKSYKLNYNQYSTFSGTGTTTSNNRGEFAFITTIPNEKEKDKNRMINISIEHINYPNLSTKILLGRHLNEHKNKQTTSFVLAKLKHDSSEYNKSESLPVYTIDLVLDGLSKYKKY